MAFLSLMVFISCKKLKTDDVVACSVKNPIQNLTWLNQKYNQLTGGPEMNSIILYEYNGNNVIEFNSAIYSSLFGYQYNCEGVQLMKDNITEINDYRAKRKLISVLYGTWEGIGK